MLVKTVFAGKKGAILHVNRQHIAANAKDGGNRPVYTLKPNGPNSKAIYAREVGIEGPSRFVHDGSRLACGARAWCEIPFGVPLTLFEPMDFKQAKNAD